MKILPQLFLCLLMQTICVICSGVKESTKSTLTTTANSDASKPKRDASLSIGYNGPSHKYLPPAVSNTYDSFSYDGGSLHGNLGSHGGHGSISSTAVGAGSAYDFFSLNLADGYHGHQSHVQQLHGSSGGGSIGLPYVPSLSSASTGTYHQSPSKVETYIVQTERAGSRKHGGDSAHTYKYAFAPSGYQHKLHTTYVLPASTSVSSTSNEHAHPHSHTDSYNSYHKLTSGHSLADVGYTTGVGHSNHGTTYHYAPSSSSVSSLGLEHAGHTGLLTSVQPYSKAHHHNHHNHGISGGGGGSLGVGHFSGSGGLGYQYEIPNLQLPVAHKTLTGYAVPSTLLSGHRLLGSGISSYEHKHNSGTSISHDDATPVYALGHKGLGHFSYTSSKPHALNTDFIDSTALHSTEGSGSDSSHLIAEISKAPFKPSVFLGVKHEGVSTNTYSESNDSFQQQHQHQATSSQYLPPTSAGYEYQSPTVLYSSSTHTADAVTPIFEPEGTYLPPEDAQPSHGYLPPTHH